VARRNGIEKEKTPVESTSDRRGSGLKGMKKEGGKILSLRRSARRKT